MQTQLMVKNLSYSRDNNQDLLANLNFTLNSGELLWVSGANGAGKSTLLRILTGLLSYSEGEISWNNYNVQSHLADYQKQLLYFGHKTGIKSDLTVSENLSLNRLMEERAGDYPIEDVLLRLNLSAHKNQLVKHLSAGQKQRVALARLWITKAKLWILDEPFAAIDKEGITAITQCLMEHCQKGGITVFSSHISLDLQDVPIKHVSL